MCFHRPCVAYVTMVSVISENNFFHLCLILIYFHFFFIITKVFFLHLMYSYEILNNFCDNDLHIIIFKN